MPPRSSRILRRGIAPKRFLAEGPTKASIWLEGGLQIDLRVLPDHLYGNLLQHFTGSREHNIRLREYAVRKNLRVSENGILNLDTGEVVTCSDEAGVYAALGMQYILSARTAQWARRSRLGAQGRDPRTGASASNLRGDFHMHTTYSDGDDTVEAMIAEARRRAVTTITQSAIIRWGGGRRFGMDPEARAASTRRNTKGSASDTALRTLQGSEVIFLPDGSLDFDDDVLPATRSRGSIGS